MSAERVLFVVAHPDDGEFSCGGTMAKWRAQGTEVHVVVVTDGTRGSHDTSISDEDLAAQRRQEQLRASERLGVAHVEFLDERDGELVDSDRLQAGLVRAIRRVRPQLLLSHDPRSAYLRHPDHWVVGEAVWKAVYRAREPRYTPDGDAASTAWAPEELWLFHTDRPEHVEELDQAALEAKFAALLCHESQFPTSMGFSVGDEAGAERFHERVFARARAMGERAGLTYGEGYARLPLT